jgi:hypothetical protein
MDNIRTDGVYVPSEDIVAREIDGELIIVPLATGVGDLEEDLYTLNETGRAVWARLDGKASLAEIARALADEYDGLPAEIEQDVYGLVGELLKRRIVVETATG